VNLELLQTLMLRSLEEQKALRRDSVQMQSLLVSLADLVRRLERRMGETRDDIEVMVKTELMGRLGHFETQMEGRLEAIEARLPPL